jgi:hypothetical protein
MRSLNFAAFVIFAIVPVAHVFACLRSRTATAKFAQESSTRRRILVIIPVQFRDLQKISDKHHNLAQQSIAASVIASEIKANSDVQTLDTYSQLMRTCERE